MITYIDNRKISSKQAKDILNDLWSNSSDIDEIIQNKNIEQLSDIDILTKEAQKILEKHPKEFKIIKNGKDKLMGFLLDKS